MHKTKTNKFINRGFSLIELMVSISIFTIALLVSSGAILSVLSANKKSQTLQVVMDNLNVSLESMTRDIRFGSKYFCGPGWSPGQVLDCATSGRDQMYFLQSDNLTNVQYYWDSATNKIMKRKLPDPTGFPITGDDVKITSLSFTVSGTSITDHKQPRVLITVQGETNVGKTSTKSDFFLETLISQRNFDSE